MSKKSNEPITFVEPSFLLMAGDFALMDQGGRLALFTVRSVADYAAGVNSRALGKPVTVQPVWIKPDPNAQPTPRAHVMNPESAILQQLDHHWQQIAALLVWKLAQNGVTLTEKEISQFPTDLVLFTHGHKDSIDFKLVTREQAEQLAKFDAAQAGHA